MDKNLENKVEILANPYTILKTFRQVVFTVIIQLFLYLDYRT